ncbi:peptidoglycan editing factor PgeF [bacterium]|nr:peptidoglycan editing factor PgeF [bacterium]
MNGSGWEIFRVGPALGFITRRTGNASSDPIATVRKLLEKIAPGTEIARVHQVHGREVHHAEGPTSFPYPRADALVADRSGLAVTVLTADCVPVLLADDGSRLVGAVHAGRRGVMDDVIGAALGFVERRFGIPPADLHVHLGPAIGPCCYEVSAGLAEDFTRRWGGNFVIMGEEGQSRLDLPGLVIEQLKRRGVLRERIILRNDCTSCNLDRYYSYRAEGDAAGRHVSGVLLKP